MKKLLAIPLLLSSLGFFFAFDSRLLGNLPQNSFIVHLGVLLSYFLFALSNYFLFNPNWRSFCLYGISAGLGLFLFLGFFRWQQVGPNSLSYYNYPLGNCSEWLGPIIKTDLGQRVASNALSQLKPSLAYIVSVSEDVCRVMAVKSELSKVSLPNFCSELNSKDRLTCFLAFNEKIQSITPYSTTGIILSEAIGVTNIMRGKKEESVRLARKLNECEQIKHEANLLEIVAQGIRLMSSKNSPKFISPKGESKQFVRQNIIDRFLGLVENSANIGDYFHLFFIEMPNRDTEIAALGALDKKLAIDANSRMHSMAEKLLVGAEKEILACSGVRAPSSIKDPDLRLQIDRITVLKKFFEESQRAN